MQLNHFIISQKPVGKARRDIANIISQATGLEAHFSGVPKMMYQIGGWTIERDGTLKSPEVDFANLSILKTVIGAISSQGIEFEGYLNFEISDDEFSDSQQSNLKNVLQRKEYLINKALGVDFEIVFGESIQFNRFRATSNLTVLLSYIHFVHRLIDHARNISKASSKPKPVLNEKYEFRCFLLRLGFIGDEYKDDRKILLSNLNGNSAFKNGCQKP